MVPRDDPELMNQPPEDIGPSRVQGCLLGAVGLFIVLLLALLVIAFFRFEEFTGDEEPVVSLLTSPTLESPAPAAQHPLVATVLPTSLR